MLQPKINVIILRINEAGLFNCWNEKIIQLLKVRRIFATDNDDNGDGIDASYSLKFSDLKTVFIAILLELFVCCLVFAGEFIVHKCHTHVKRKYATVDKALFDYVN